MLVEFVFKLTQLSVLICPLSELFCLLPIHSTNLSYIRKLLEIYLFKLTSKMKGFFAKKYTLEFNFKI